MKSPEENPDYNEDHSVADVHASVKREQEDPQTGLEPATIRVFAVCALLLMVGGAYLGANGWFARADGSQLERFAFERLPGLVDVAELELEWKLHPQLVAGATPSWTRVPRSSAASSTFGVTSSQRGSSRSNSARRPAASRNGTSSAYCRSPPRMRMWTFSDPA